MRFERRRPRNDDERILPLINVVFLLLIFFLLAGRLAAPDPFGIEPPRSASEALAEVPEWEVQIGADGALGLDGEAMDEAALEATLRDRLSAAGADAPEPRLRLKADARASAVRVVSVMDRLRAAGVRKLTLFTVPDDA